MMSGVNSDDTILYAPEIKFYSVKAVLDNKLETEIENLYGRGDGLGVTSGIIVASSILEKIGKK